MRALLLIMIIAIGLALIPKPSPPRPIVEATPTQRQTLLQSPTPTDDIHANAAWAVHLDDPQERETAIAEVAITWADDDPEAAATFLLSHTRPGQAQRNAAIGVLQRMASKDIERAAAWAASFPEDVREQALTQIDRIRGHASARPLELDVLSGNP